jgi:predicted nucleic acid-binding protein
VIVVDTSVWIDHLRGTTTPSVRRLRALIPRGQILVGDLILCEILQGLRSETQAILVEATLRRFTVTSLLDPDLAIIAAANYRQLRRAGITVRKTIDMIIGTFCIERGYALLHSDRDFVPMERFLGLRTV